MKKILLILVLFLTSCTTNKPALQKFSNITLDAGFNTVIDFTGYTETKDDFDEIFNQIVEDFTYLNKLFDIYNDYEDINNIKTINDFAGIKPVEVDPIIIDMLLLAKDFYELSEHEFDVSFGAVLKIWHNYREIALNELNGVGPIPTFEELNALVPYTGFEFVEIDSTNNTVYLSDANVRLDVGGIAKGYATEYVAKKLENSGLIGIINAGGNNRTLGSKPDGKPWGIGIRNPLGNGSSIVIAMDGAISAVTSGDYERFYVDSDGNKYHHIIDPKTLFPADYFRSVTVLTKDSGMADAMSTTLYTLDVEKGLEVVKEFKDKFNTDIDALWIVDKDQKITADNIIELPDFNIVYTDGLKDKLSY